MLPSPPPASVPRLQGTAQSTDGSLGLRGPKVRGELNPNDQRLPLRLASLPSASDAGLFGFHLFLCSIFFCLIECGYCVNLLMFPMGPKRFIGRCRDGQLELFRKLLETALAVLHNKRISTSSCRDLDLPSSWTSLRFPPRHRDLCRDDLIGVHRNRWGQWAEIELEVLGPHDVLLCSLTLIRWRP